ncbi:MAG: phage regulatory CII family protein [Burkholderiaceae bacterium]
MNIIDSAHAVVHGYPGGSESLGPRVGISPAVLRNKVNPNNETHHLTLAEAARITALTGDFRILQAWAHSEGFLLVKAPDGTTSDMAVLEQVVGLGVANGQFMQTIHSALADGVVSQKELAAIKEAERAVQTAAATVTSRVEGMAQ